MLGIHGKASSRSARARCLALLLVAGAIVAPRDARAVPPGASNAAALGRFEEGKKAFDSGKFEEALIAFQASQSLLPSPNSRLYIARCYRALGKVASAYTNFRLASREAQDRLGATGEKRYSATRDAAASEAAEIEPKVPRLTLAVASDLPDGFVVKVDGAEILKAAWGTAIETDPGEHTVEASGPRLSPFSKSVSLKEGAQVRIAVEATRLPTASIAMRFATRPAGLAMELDGRPLDANAAEARRETDVGVHRIVVHAPGYKDFVWEKSLDDHGDEVVDVHLEPDLEATRGKGPPKWLFFGAAGLAVASVAAGTIFAVHASSTASDETAKDPLLRDPAVRDDVKSAATRANVFFIAGAALGVGAGALFFLTDWKSADEKKQGARFAPWIGPSAGGVAAREEASDEARARSRGAGARERLHVRRARRLRRRRVRSRREDAIRGSVQSNHARGRLHALSMRRDLQALRGAHARRRSRRGSAHFLRRHRIATISSRRNPGSPKRSATASRTAAAGSSTRASTARRATRSFNK